MCRDIQTSFGLLISTHDAAANWFACLTLSCQLWKLLCLSWLSFILLLKSVVITDFLSSSQLQWPVPVVSGQLLGVLGRGVALLCSSQLQTIWRGESNLCCTLSSEDLKKKKYKWLKRTVPTNVCFRFWECQTKETHSKDSINHLHLTCWVFFSQNTLQNTVLILTVIW